MNKSSHSSLYWQYLQQTCPTIAPDLPSIHVALETTAWDEPQSPLDWNNYGVIALIEAEYATNLDFRRLYVETAIAAFDNGANDHPLCAAHLALTYSLIGEAQTAGEIALANFVQTLQPLHTKSEQLAPGLVYLPLISLNGEQASRLVPIVQQEDGFTQAFLLLGEVLSHQLQAMFYNKVGQRFLHLAVHIAPQSVTNNFLLGIAGCINGKWENLFYLHRAQQLAPEHPAILQALYLVYRDQQEDQIATMWLETARQLAANAEDAASWRWTTLTRDRPFTYVSFEIIQLAVRASLLTITTGVLLAKNDWFEAEMEFWRNQIQPGMTVIDVGANVGVYTFSAAQRVGKTGFVLAVEPFSACVQCLQETCKINEFHWVKVIAGAASDRNHTAQLALQSASELNRLIPDAELTDADTTETVSCFTLDALLEQDAIAHVDFLKIDAEGHEMQVLAGSEYLLTKLMPTIIYENIAGIDQANTSVATFLQEKGYQLFRYQPYLQALIPVNELDDLKMSLNVIAIHTSKL